MASITTNNMNNSFVLAAFFSSFMNTENGTEYIKFSFMEFWRRGTGLRWIAFKPVTIKVEASLLFLQTLQPWFPNENAKFTFVWKKQSNNPVLYLPSPGTTPVSWSLLQGGLDTWNVIFVAAFDALTPASVHSLPHDHVTYWPRLRPLKAQQTFAGVES